MNIQNESLLKSKPGNPNGYASKDFTWAAVPWGKKFVIIHNGEQVHTVNNYASAKSYILKEINASKKKTSTVDQFFG